MVGFPVREKLSRRLWAILSLALLASGLALPQIARAVEGVIGTVPNPAVPGPNGVQAYCDANYPGSNTIVISTGSVSSGATNERVDNGFYLQWIETYNSPGMVAQILGLKVGSAAGASVSYAAAFSWNGGNDTFIFSLGQPVTSNKAGQAAPADSLTMTGFNGNNFTQWAFCAYTTLVPVSITKNIVGGGTGTFTFAVDCKVLVKGVLVSYSGYPTEVTINVTAGGTASTTLAANVPINSVCTVTEKAGAGDEPTYDHEGPQTKTTTATGGRLSPSTTPGRRANSRLRRSSAAPSKVSRTALLSTLIVLGPPSIRPSRSPKLMQRR